jgi:ubiquinone/menaquinone biosynthesis C-methylase UbiE
MKSPLDCLFAEDGYVCPWWICFTFDNFLRKPFHKPEQILGPYIEESMTVLDIGPGMGYFTIPLARMVGPRGRVIATDIQPEMLKALMKRAMKAGVDRRITAHLCKEDSLGLDVKVDFALAFWMVHEVPDPMRFLEEMRSLLKTTGKLLISEPIIHVPSKKYAENIVKAAAIGFEVVAEPKIFLSRSVVLTVK